MEDITRGTYKLSIRNSNKKRSGSDSTAGKGLFQAVRKLFSGEAQPRYEVPRQIFQYTSELIFKSVEGLSLPELPDHKDFVVDIVTYVYAHQIVMPCDHMSEGVFTASHRRRVVLYICERHAETSQPLESFHLAVNLMDRLLVLRKVTSSNAEMYSIACLNLAAKYEVQKSLPMSILAQYPGWRNAEKEVLCAVGFDLSCHHIAHCMRVLNACVLPDTNTSPEESHAWNAAKAFSRLACSEISLVAGVAPSLAAAAIMRLTVHLLNRPWEEEFTLQSQHTAAELERVTCMLFHLVRTAVDERYSLLDDCAGWLTPRVDFARKWIVKDGV